MAALEVVAALAAVAAAAFAATTDRCQNRVTDIKKNFQTGEDDLDIMRKGIGATNKLQASHQHSWWWRR